MKKKRRICIILSVVLCLIVGIVIFFVLNQDGKILNLDNGAVDWNGNQQLNNSSGSNGDSISIPGFDSLVFIAGEKHQKVNFYNPPENRGCLFLMSLYVDNILIWKSNGYVEPGKGYYDIELAEPLESGKYQSYLHIRCFEYDGVELNSAKVTFNLFVE